jgi:hypothetical protein
MGAGCSKKFGCFEQLPVELRCLIMRHMETRDLYAMSRVAKKYANMVREMNLLSSRKVRKKNKFCTYFWCDGKIVGHYICAVGPVIHFVYYSKGQPVPDKMYKYNTVRQLLMDMDPFLDKDQAPKSAIQPWKKCANLNNRHLKIILGSM